MQKTTIMVLGWAIMCTVLLTCAEGQEQQTKDLTDLTGRLDVTCKEIAQGLGLNVACGERAFLPQVALPSPGRIGITIPFDFNSARIKQDAVHNLQQIGLALEAASNRIRIVGHTDGVGRAQANLRLSERRAQSVKQYLVDNFSIAAERLLVVGRGAQDPIADNTTDEGRQKNRRVVLVNLERQQQ
jgi:outer membrane protein OmpA-like peptidoglycan-associated protein